MGTRKVSSSRWRKEKENDGAVAFLRWNVLMRKNAHNRRSFLQVGAAGLGVVSSCGLSTSLWGIPATTGESGTPEWSKPQNPTDFRKALACPIQSQPTPFNAKLELDCPAVTNIVHRGMRYGVRIYELTAGNSQYDVLSYEEIKLLTRTMVEAVGGEGLTIAATGGWWTGQAVDYARYAESIGADAVQILYPSRSGSDDAVVEHFEAIGRATRLPLVLHGVYSEALLKRLLHIETIVAMKEDAELDYYIDRIIGFGDRIEIFSGGAENRYLVGYPYGAKAFFSTYTGFAPDISMRFWEAIKQGDIKGAVKITTRYDYPFIKGFTHPFWHATLEYFGVAKRYMRPPQLAFTDEQMKDVKKFFDGQGIDPVQYRI
jgi:dihydrodipicolinate synthase/N-acetylneuraminate lyase